MTDNPLSGKAPGPRKITAEMLHEYCAEYNSHAWVKASGIKYFVGRRWKANGEFERYIDRIDHATPPTGQAR